MDITEIERQLNEKGEIEVILDSDRSYELHLHDTTFENRFVETEGILDGEYTVVRFPAESVEHVTWHKVS